MLKELIDEQLLANKPGTSLALISLDGSNMKDPLGINELEITKDAGQEIARVIGNANEKNHNRAPGNTHLALTLLSPKDAIQHIEEKTVMPTLASKIQNTNGPVGHAVDRQTLRELGPKIKSETENQKFSFDVKK